MVVDLIALNQTLDIVLKLILLGILVLVVVIMIHIDKALRSAEKSAESIRDTAERIGNTVSLAAIIKLVNRLFGGKSKDDE